LKDGWGGIVKTIKMEKETKSVKSGRRFKEGKMCLMLKKTDTD
jgi:hypothetical protein